MRELTPPTKKMSSVYVEYEDLVYLRSLGIGTSQAIKLFCSNARSGVNKDAELEEYKEKYKKALVKLQEHLNESQYNDFIMSLNSDSSTITPVSKIQELQDDAFNDAINRQIAEG